MSMLKKSIVFAVFCFPFLLSSANASSQIYEITRNLFNSGKVTTLTSLKLGSIWRCDIIKSGQTGTKLGKGFIALSKGDYNLPSDLGKMEVTSGLEIPPGEKLIFEGNNGVQTDHWRFRLLFRETSKHVLIELAKKGRDGVTSNFQGPRDEEMSSLAIFSCPKENRIDENDIQESYGNFEVGQEVADLKNKKMLKVKNLVSIKSKMHAITDQASLLSVENLAYPLEVRCLEGICKGDKVRVVGQSFVSGTVRGLLSGGHVYWYSSSSRGYRIYQISEIEKVQ